jgi:hypothetical protein
MFGMITFSEIYAVPADHSLVLLRHSRRRRTQERGVAHEERDAVGRLVARYESWEDLRGRSSGYRKYDPDGRLLSSSDRLPG